MKILTSLKKCIAIFSLLCGIIVASNVNAQNFTYNDLIFEVISSGQVRIDGHVNGQNVTGEVDIPASVSYNGLNYAVTEIGENAFGGCSGLNSIIIPNSVTTIDAAAFYGCSGLTSINIPNSVTTIDGDDAFYGCSGLTAINVDSTNPVYDSRNNCNAIINTADNYLQVGCINTLIPNSVTIIGYHAFGGCSGLTSITIPNSVIWIAQCAFTGCSGLTSITIPNSVIRINDGTFGGCSGLTSITIPNSVTSIGYYAFTGCSGLTSIIIPNSVTTIDDYAFEGCSGLKTVISYSQRPPELGNSAFSGIGTATLFVPQYCVPLYIASNWYDYFTTILEYHESVSEVDEINVSVYPNPAVGKMIIEADNIKNISIYSATGQLIYETPATGDTFEYDFGKHGAGVYLVRIETLKGVGTKKVTIK